MRVYTNEPYIKRRAKIGQIVSWAGLAVLALGLFITIRTSPGVFLRFSNDPAALAREVSRNRNAIGFMSFDDLQLAADPVTVIPIDGVAPSQETIDSGEYPVMDSTGAVVVIINPQNTWIGEAGLDMATLARTFSTEYRRWIDVNSAWPAQAVVRMSLSQDNNPAFTTFVDVVMEPVYGVQGETLLVGTVNPNYSRMVLASLSWPRN